jgi:hypothetical protein
MRRPASQETEQAWIDAFGELVVRQMFCPLESVMPNPGSASLVAAVTSCLLVPITPTTSPRLPNTARETPIDL